MTATTELREAAEQISASVSRAEAANNGTAEFIAACVELTAMGFCIPTVALAIAAWLIEEADTLDLLNIEPTAALAVARCINEGATP